MDYKKAFEKMMNEKYYPSRDLKYDTKVGILLSAYDYKLMLDYIDEGKGEIFKHVNKLNLESFNNQKLHFSNCVELSSLMGDYMEIVIKDLLEFDKGLSLRNNDEIIRSRVFSEIEGTLNIEDVPTTRKLVSELSNKKRKPQNRNETIIVNMINAIEFVNSCPDFNKENLYKLYNILSKDCLDEEDKLLPGHIYRHDEVEIDNYEGCPHEKVESRMDSLFTFVNDNLNKSNIKYLLPHIAHYYVVYIHPYFDYNGRTARMVSYWISLLTNSTILPPVISEAINQTKKDYYASLRESRNARNDITYFLLYIYKISISYFLTYRNIEEVNQKLKNENIELNETERNYLKRILISNEGKFTYQDFVKWCNVKMSKQAAFKILNKFEALKILQSDMNNKRKYFSVNPSVVIYKFDFNH